MTGVAKRFCSICSTNSMTESKKREGKEDAHAIL